MNLCIFTGNIASDIDMRSTASGKAVAQFRLAVQRDYTNPQGVREADFFTVIAWESRAEYCARYLCKGRKIMVKGSMHTRTYDAQDGSRRTVTELTAEKIEPADNNRREDGQNTQTSVTPAANSRDDGFTDVSDDEELPF